MGGHMYTFSSKYHDSMFSYSILYRYEYIAVLWIRIQIGSVFKNVMDSYSEYGSGSTQSKLREKRLMASLIQNFLCLRCFSKIKLFLSVTSQCQRLGSGSPNWVNSQDPEYAVTNFRMMFFTTFFICFS